MAFINWSNASLAIITTYTIILGKSTEKLNGSIDNVSKAYSIKNGSIQPKMYSGAMSTAKCTQVIKSMK